MKHTVPEPKQRFERLEKRRRTNRVLNLFIAIVVVLIFIFAYTLISDRAKEKASDQTQQNGQVSENGNGVGNSKENNGSDGTTDSNSAVEESPEEVNERVIVPTDEPGVIEAFTNPSWGPIGTAQSEPHVTQFDTSSQDWKEMVKATAYATELDESDFIVWFIGNGGAPNKAISTIQTRDKQYKYRVYIEWVENEGWKPTLVEQLET